MKVFLDSLDQSAPLKILDVGSLQAEPDHKVYRSLCSKNWEYYGLDLVKGPNVDIVANHPHRWPMLIMTFDVVISGQTLEHCSHPLELMQEIFRILKPGGQIFIIAPSAGKAHCRPDYWRFLPDGIFLLLTYAKFRNVQVKQCKTMPWMDVTGKGNK